GRAFPGKLQRDVGSSALGSARRGTEDVVIDLALGASEGIQPLRANDAVEDERNRRAEDGGLAGAVLAEQEEPAVGNEDLLVVEVPVIDQKHPMKDVASGLPPRAGLQALGEQVQATPPAVAILRAIGETKQRLRLEQPLLPRAVKHDRLLPKLG